jgi:hypothetical protein
VEGNQNDNVQDGLTNAAAVLEEEERTPSPAQENETANDQTVPVESGAVAMIQEEVALLTTLQEAPVEVISEQEARESGTKVDDAEPTQKQRIASPSETSELTVESLDEEANVDSKPAEEDSPAADADPLTQSVPALPAQSGGEKKEEESFFTCFSAFKFW